MAPAAKSTSTSSDRLNKAASSSSKLSDNEALSEFLSRFHLTTKQQELLLRVSSLVLIYIVAFAIRLFSVLRYESVIHEFDPYFNYRTTLFLTEKGFYEFWNWFDHETWYPLGRIVGFTLYPGLMITSTVVYWTMRALTLVVNIRDVCVLTGPFFASNTAIVAYFFGKEVRDSSTGLLAAAFLAICPGYISRSVAGSYDYECISIFALMLTFLLFVRAVRLGSMGWAAAASFSYFYMASSWGGYIFIINMIPIYVLTLLVTGRYTPRLYVAYVTFYVLGLLLAMQIRFIGFQHVQSSEHMASLGVFLLIQVFFFVEWVRDKLSTKPKLFRTFLRVAITSALILGGVALVVGTATGYISPWTGRFYSLLDPTYAKDNIPIIASVSEHQPTSWSSFLFDFHLLLIVFPAGLYFCFRQLTDASIFLILYGMISMYFAGVMVRLILVATPALCLIGAVGVSAALTTFCKVAREGEGGGIEGVTTASEKGKAVSAKSKGPSGGSSLDLPLPFQKETALILSLLTLYSLFHFSAHCVWTSSEAYSSPSIVLMARGRGGDRVIFDDFREAYSWLKYNTPADAKVMSWWDYGYQITAMGNRTVIVDNNTWNNTHIAMVGRAMSSYEHEAIKIIRELDVDYVLVVFGGLTGYSSDDINKFLWMVRIGEGVFPVIKESDYLTPEGDYRVDKGAAPKMLETLMYKMCYYRFGETVAESGRPEGFDRARGYQIGKLDVKLEYIEEAFTSLNWIVRIYKVKKEENRH